VNSTWTDRRLKLLLRKQVSAINWQSTGNQLAINWQSTGNQLAINWQSTGNQLAINYNPK
jgi:hypothetical protein